MTVSSPVVQIIAEEWLLCVCVCTCVTCCVDRGSVSCEVFIIVHLHSFHLMLDYARGNWYLCYYCPPTRPGTQCNTLV